MNYTPCQTFDDLISLFMEFRGEAKLLSEIVTHRMNCQTCQNNAIAITDYQERHRQNCELCNGTPLPIGWMNL